MTTAADAPMKVLVVDDDPDIREVVATTLTGEGYDVRQLSDATGFATTLENFTPNLIVLDIEIGSPNGLELLEKMRRGGDERAVVLMTSRGEESDRIRGLDLGADDYVTKPFSVKELASRVRAVLRRHMRVVPDTQAIMLGPLTVDPSSRTVNVSGENVYFTRMEFGVLHYMAVNAGRAISREDLLRNVWGSEEAWQDPETVTEHVRRVRLKLRDAGLPDMIATLRGIGYRLDSSATAS